MEQEESAPDIENQPQEDTPQKQHVLSKLAFKTKPFRLVIFAVVVVVAGGITGYILSGSGAGGLKSGKVEVAPGAVSKGKEIGLTDEATFRDSATGILRSGGIDGEGTHHLEREGGPTQNVYITSSVIDLEEFVDTKVEVWGETFSAQTAGWLMDVGRLKIVE